MVKKKTNSDMLNIKNSLICLRILFVISVFNLISCTNRSNAWPAHIIDISGFSDEEKTEVIKSIDDLNLRSNRSFVIFNNNDDGNQKITISKGEPHEDVLGQAGVSDGTCFIQLMPEAFKNDFLTTVVWHELGHCSGLDHSSDYPDIMYYSVRPLVQYEPSSIYSFLLSLSKSFI